MGGGLIIGAVVSVVIVLNLDKVKRVLREHLRQRRIAKELEAAADAAAAKAAREGEPSPPRYESLRELHMRDQRDERHVHFASTTVDHYHSKPSPWRSAFYEPNRQRFETIVVDGIYVRHGFSSSGHSIEEMF